MQLELDNKLFKAVMHHANAENISIKGKIVQLLEQYINDINNNEECQHGMTNEESKHDQFEGIGETSAH